MIHPCTRFDLSCAQCRAMRPDLVPAPDETHRWKVGLSTWVTLTVTGHYGEAEHRRFLDHVALIEPDPRGQPDPDHSCRSDVRPAEKKP